MKKRGFEAVESEIHKEKAEALGRAGERLGRSLQKLDASRRELLDLLAAAQKSVSDGEERFSVEIKQSLDEYARLYEQARELRRSLIIQREAVGLWGYEDVGRQYPLPRLLTLATAIRPEGAGG